MVATRSQVSRTGLGSPWSLLGQVCQPALVGQSADRVPAQRAAVPQHVRGRRETRQTRLSIRALACVKVCCSRAEAGQPVLVHHTASAPSLVRCGGNSRRRARGPIAPSTAASAARLVPGSSTVPVGVDHTGAGDLFVESSQLRASHRRARAPSRYPAPPQRRPWQPVRMARSRLRARVCTGRAIGRDRDRHRQLSTSRLAHSVNLRPCHTVIGANRRVPLLLRPRATAGPAAIQPQPRSPSPATADTQPGQPLHVTTARTPRHEVEVVHDATGSATPYLRAAHRLEKHAATPPGSR